MGGFWVVLWWAGASIFPWQAEAPTCSTPVPIYAFIVFFGAGKVSVFSHFYRSRKTNGQIDVFEKNRPNCSSGVQIPREICTRFGFYLYSFVWRRMLNTIMLSLLLLLLLLYCCLTVSQRLPLEYPLSANSAIPHQRY